MERAYRLADRHTAGERGDEAEQPLARFQIGVNNLAVGRTTLLCVIYAGSLTGEERELSATSDGLFVYHARVIKKSR